METSTIRDFYKDQTIFITGGTGFVGKVIIEKLLRVCHDVRRIYVLTRPKKGKTPQERHRDFFEFPCFERLKSIRTDFQSQVVLIEGDCDVPALGITPESRDILLRETTIVIHAAANVKFDQPLRQAALTVNCVQDIIKLAKEMPLLKSFVYVSTAFSNCPQKHIEEEFYKPPMTATELFDYLDKNTDDIVDAQTPKILKSWPNTYVFVKTIAEDVIKNEAKLLPVAIVRPAIIATTVAEPMAGWIDNFYGVVGISVAAGLGVIRSLHAGKQNAANIVPCDFVANNVLAAAWYATQEKKPKIYNYTGSQTNYLTWGTFMKETEDCGFDYIPVKMVWYYCFELRENYYWHSICIFFMHTVVAHIVDFFLICALREPLAVDNYARIDKLLSLSGYFSSRSWTFTTSNVKDLWDTMSVKDKKLFNFDMDVLDFKSYVKNSVIGGRQYLLKDPLETIPWAKKKMNFFMVAHYSSICLMLYFLYKIIFAFLQVLI